MGRIYQDAYDFKNAHLEYEHVIKNYSSRDPYANLGLASLAYENSTFLRGKDQKQ